MITGGVETCRAGKQEIEEINLLYKYICQIVAYGSDDI
jgi:hypothetical protein